MLLALARGIDAMNDAIGRAVCWLSLLVILVATGNALLRYGLRIGSNASMELQWYLFALIFLPTTIALTVLSFPMVASSIEVWERSPDVGGLARWPIKLAIPVFTFMGVVLERSAGGG